MCLLPEVNAYFKQHEFGLESVSPCLFNLKKSGPEKDTIRVNPRHPNEGSTVPYVVSFPPLPAHPNHAL